MKVYDVILKINRIKTKIDKERNEYGDNPDEELIEILEDYIEVLENLKVRE